MNDAGHGMGENRTMLCVRCRDFLVAGLSYWKYRQMVSAGALRPLPQVRTGKRVHHLFPASELGKVTAGMPAKG